MLTTLDGIISRRISTATHLILFCRFVKLHRAFGQLQSIAASTPPAPTYLSLSLHSRNHELAAGRIATCLQRYDSLRLPSLAVSPRQLTILSPSSKQSRVSLPTLNSVLSCQFPSQSSERSLQSSSGQERAAPPRILINPRDTTVKYRQSS